MSVFIVVCMTALIIGAFLIGLAMIAEYIGFDWSDSLMDIGILIELTALIIILIAICAYFVYSLWRMI